MRRIIATAAAVAAFVSLNAKPYPVKDFDIIEAGFSYNITLVKSDRCSVDIEASEDIEPYLDVRVKGHRLVLSTKNLPGRFKMDKNSFIRARISMPVINGLELSSAAKLTSEDYFILSSNFDLSLSGAAKVSGLGIVSPSSVYFDMSGAAEAIGLNIKSDSFHMESSGAAKGKMIITADKCEFELSGASKQDLEIDSSYLGIDISGASKLNLHCSGTEGCEAEASGSSSTILSGGRLKSMGIEASGACQFDASSMPAEKVAVKASGAAQVKLAVSKHLDAEATGASKIYYIEDGHLDYVSKSSSAAGKINRMSK